MACVLALTLGWDSSAQERKAQGFTPQELKDLEAGKLVRRPKTESRDGYKLFGGQSWQVINRPPEEAWDDVRELTSYTKMVPGLTKVAVTGRRGQQVSAEFTHNHGPIDVSYPLRFEFSTDKRTVVFRLDHSRPSDLRAGWGFVKLRRWKKTKTLLSFAALVDIGEGILMSMVRPSILNYILLVPTKAKNFMERNKSRASNEALEPPQLP